MQKAYRVRQNEAKKQQRLEKNRENMAAARATETPEETEKLLEQIRCINSATRPPEILKRQINKWNR